MAVANLERSPGFFSSIRKYPGYFPQASCRENESLAGKVDPVK
jgi:hypothetical protein